MGLLLRACKTSLVCAWQSPGIWWQPWTVNKATRAMCTQQAEQWGLARGRGRRLGPRNIRLRQFAPTCTNSTTACARS